MTMFSSTGLLGGIAKDGLSQGRHVPKRKQSVLQRGGDRWPLPRPQTYPKNPLESGMPQLRAMIKAKGGPLVLMTEASARGTKGREDPDSKRTKLGGERTN